MTGTRPADILRQLEQSGEADAELLARFATAKDTHAFAELVRRHGPLVLGVCRRVTGHPQDAEDAFQAAFLVLAKRAASIRNAAILGNWLYGVAFRVAWKARRSAARRRAREVVVSALPEVPAPSTSPMVTELTPILDEELAALSACHRDAILLCDLRGMSRAEAAVVLGIPEGTLSSRLANGRKKLAVRLAKRGITLSVAMLPAALSEAMASGAIPNELVTKTCSLVENFAAGGVVPRSLTRLAEGGFTMRKSLLLAAVLVFALGGAVVAARSGEDAPPNDPPKPLKVVAEKPEAKEELKPGEKQVAFTTTPRMRLATDVVLVDSTAMAWSGDGKFFAIQGKVVAANDVDHGFVNIALFAIHNESFTLLGTWRTSSMGELVGFTPDSRELITQKREYQLVSGLHWIQYFTLPNNIEKAIKEKNTMAVRKVNLDLPQTYGHAFAPDGKTYRTAAWHWEADKVKMLEVLEVNTATGKTNKSLLEVDYGRYVFAPNGKRLAIFDKDIEKVTVYDIDRGAKQFEYVLGGGKLAELPPVASRFVVGSEKVTRANWQTWPQSSPEVVFSSDARRLVVSRAIGQTVVLNAETGEAMSVLEGSKEARLHADEYAFTSDGRLLAMSGTNYALGEEKPGGWGSGSRKPIGGEGGKAQEQMVWKTGGSFLTVWDTQTGKMVKSWNRPARVAFCPTQPLLAILEPNGESVTRVGLWDFSPEVEKK